MVHFPNFGGKKDFSGKSGSVTHYNPIMADLCQRFLITSAMVSFKIETLNSGGNPPLQNLFIKFDVAVASFKSSAKDGSLKRASK